MLTLQDELAMIMIYAIYSEAQSRLPYPRKAWTWALTSTP